MSASRALGFVTIALLATTAAQAADDAQAVFDSLYRRKLEVVAKTPTTADDLALAEELLTAAAGVQSQPRLMELMCESAATLAGKDPGGSGTAIKALRMIAAKFPERADVTLERIITIQQKLYSSARGRKTEAAEALASTLGELAEVRWKSGNHAEALTAYKRALSVAIVAEPSTAARLRQRYDALSRSYKIETRIAELKPLAGSSKDAAKLLVMTYMVDLDDPATALPVARQSGDAALAANVAAAVKTNEQISEAETLTLGDWYRGLSDAAEPASKPAMLLRAHRYYTLYLGRHTASDLLRTKAELASRDVDAAMQRLGVEAPAPAAAPTLASPVSAASPATAPTSAAEPSTRMTGGSRTVASSRIEPVKPTETPADDKPNKLFEALRAPKDMRRDTEAEKPVNDGGPAWIDLLPEHQGNAYGLVGDGRSSMVKLPVKLEGDYNYDLRLVLEPTEKRMGFCRVYLLAGEGRVLTLVLDGPATGVEYLDGQPYAKGPAVTRDSRFPQNEKTEFLVSVRRSGEEVGITVKVNDTQLIDWHGTLEQVGRGVRDFVALQGWTGVTMVHAAQWRPRPRARN